MDFLTLIIGADNNRWINFDHVNRRFNDNYVLGSKWLYLSATSACWNWIKNSLTKEIQKRKNENYQLMGLTQSVIKNWCVEQRQKDQQKTNTETLWYKNKNKRLNISFDVSFCLLFRSRRAWYELYFFYSTLFSTLFFCSILFSTWF